MLKIPKKIHYFWFGKSPIPKEIKEYLDSWRKYCPEYKIIKWDESNFDLNKCVYAKEAYEAKKWAFVSDYARVKILEEQGGVYLDTDVELIRSIDSIIEKGPFINLEVTAGNKIGPGMSCIGAAPHMQLFNYLVNEYEKRHFLLQDGTYDEMPIGDFVKEKLLQDGMVEKNKLQNIDGVILYPTEYFSPIDFTTGKKNLTSNTLGIHHYAGSWLTPAQKRNQKISQLVTKYLGVKISNRLRDIYHQTVKKKNEEN